MKKTILLTLLVMLTACSVGAANELERNRQTWQNSGITHYRFSLSIGCFCPFRDQMPLTVEVQDNEVIAMTHADGTPVAETDPNYETFSRYATVERVFAELQAAQSGKADEVTVTYDGTYGFPRDIYIDFIKNAVDDELSLQLSDFEALK